MTVDASSSGEPGPEGPEGPAGPTGPTGPAGGAAVGDTFLLQASMVNQTLATLAFQITAALPYNARIVDAWLTVTCFTDDDYRLGIRTGPTTSDTLTGPGRWRIVEGSLEGHLAGGVGVRPGAGPGDVPYGNDIAASTPLYLVCDQFSDLSGLMTGFVYVHCVRV